MTTIPLYVIATDHFASEPEVVERAAALAKRVDDVLAEREAIAQARQSLLTGDLAFFHAGGADEVRVKSAALLETELALRLDLGEFAEWLETVRTRMVDDAVAAEQAAMAKAEKALRKLGYRPASEDRYEPGAYTHFHAAILAHPDVWRARMRTQDLRNFDFAPYLNLQRDAIRRLRETIDSAKRIAMMNV